VISAHRDRHFKSLGKIVVGDTILTDASAGRRKWTVSRIRVVDADAPVLRISKTPLLTLTTCWPVRYFGPAPERLIVEAKLVGTSD
jgi:sortase A